MNLEDALKSLDNATSALKAEALQLEKSTQPRIEFDKELWKNTLYPLIRAVDKELRQS